jgi:hypothetical protein
MMNIIDGERLSVYVVKAITLAKATKADSNGIVQTYAVLTMKNKKAPGESPTRHIMFESDHPDLLAILKKYVSQNRDAQGGALVDLQALKAPEAKADFDEIEGYLTWNGGMCMQYPLRKGECYANDIDGKRLVRKSTGQPVIKSTVSVFVQVLYAETTDNGLKYHYAKGLSPEDQGPRIEDTFYREAVARNNAVDAAAGVEPAADGPTNPDDVTF